MGLSLGNQILNESSAIVDIYVISIYLAILGAAWIIFKDKS